MQAAIAPRAVGRVALSSGRAMVMAVPKRALVIENAHKKGAGSTKNGRDSNSKRRGVKSYGGQPIKAGAIIVRQLGSTVSSRAGESNGALWGPAFWVGVAAAFCACACVCVCVGAAAAAATTSC
jgi:hypothetical protein